MLLWLDIKRSRGICNFSAPWMKTSIAKLFHDHYVELAVRCFAVPSHHRPVKIINLFTNLDACLAILYKVQWFNEEDSRTSWTILLDVDPLRSRFPINRTTQRSNFKQKPKTLWIKKRTAKLHECKKNHTRACCDRRMRGSLTAIFCTSAGSSPESAAVALRRSSNNCLCESHKTAIDGLRGMT